MSSGHPPPMSPGEAEIVRLLKMLLAVVQVLAAFMAVLILMLAGWLLGILPDIVSPIVEVRL